MWSTGFGFVFDREIFSDTEKQTNQGWGRPGSEYEPEQAKPAEEQPPVEESSPVVEEKPAEEEEQVKTLDQYLAERAEKLKLAGIQRLQARKVEADDPKWKNAKLLQSKKEEFFVVQTTTTTTSSSSSSKKTKKQKKTKLLLDIEQRFNDTETRGRGSRGGFRGGRGGSRGGRNARPSSNDMNMDDQSAFPALH
jgi:plasminogen activator inhibitor 1 RNA-binding protein